MRIFYEILLLTGFVLSFVEAAVFHFSAVYLYVHNTDGGQATTMSAVCAISFYSKWLSPVA